MAKELKWRGNVSYFEDDYSTCLYAETEFGLYTVSCMLYGKAKIWQLEYQSRSDDLIDDIGPDEVILETDNMADCLEYAKEHEFLEKLKA